MFKTDSRFFDDLAKAATGAVSALSGARQQIQAEIKSQVNRFIVEMDFVPRADFETVEAMAVEARLQNQKLEARLAQLEAHIGFGGAPKAKAAKKATSKKSTAKKAK